MLIQGFIYVGCDKTSQIWFWAKWQAIYKSRFGHYFCFCHQKYSFYHFENSIFCNAAKWHLKYSEIHQTLHTCWYKPPLISKNSCLTLSPPKTEIKMTICLLISSYLENVKTWKFQNHFFQNNDETQNGHYIGVIVLGWYF